MKTQSHDHTHAKKTDGGNRLERGNLKPNQQRAVTRPENGNLGATRGQPRNEQSRGQTVEDENVNEDADQRANPRGKGNGNSQSPQGSQGTAPANVRGNNRSNGRSEENKNADTESRGDQRGNDQPRNRKPEQPGEAVTQDDDLHGGERGNGGGDAQGSAPNARGNNRSNVRTEQDEDEETQSRGEQRGNQRGNQPANGQGKNRPSGRNQENGNDRPGENEESEEHADSPSNQRGSQTKSQANGRGNERANGRGGDSSKSGGDQQRQNGGNQEEMMKKMRAAGTPGQAHQVLKALEGSWNVEAQCMSTQKHTHGHAVVRPILGGHFWLEEFQGEMDGKSFHGKLLLGYDNTKQKYTSVWMDDANTSMNYSEGKAEQGNKVITFEGVSACPATGRQEVPVKHVFRLESPSKRVSEMYADGEKRMEITYTRQ